MNGVRPRRPVQLKRPGVAGVEYFAVLSASLSWFPAGFHELMFGSGCGDARAGSAPNSVAIRRPRVPHRSAHTRLETQAFARGPTPLCTAPSAAPRSARGASIRMHTSQTPERRLGA
jgi:hypothetical protein